MHTRTAAIKPCLIILQGIAMGPGVVDGYHANRYVKLLMKIDEPCEPFLLGSAAAVFVHFSRDWK